MNDLQAMTGPTRLPDEEPAPAFTPPVPLPNDDGWRHDSPDFHLVTQVTKIFTSDECDDIVGLVDELGQQDGGVAGEEDTSTRVDRDVRRARQTRIPRDDSHRWIYDRLAEAVDGCNRSTFGFDLRDFHEELALIEYRQGDFYDWHLDLGRAAQLRKLSVSVMLTDPEQYEGGDLTFPGARFGAIPKGHAVVFPSFLLHGIQPLRRGVRHALVAWIAGPRFR